MVSPGADDDTISTGQNFDITAYFTLVGNLADSARLARIALPAGYAVSDSTIKPIVADSVTWTVIAPNSPSQPDYLDLMRVRLNGIDANSGEAVQAVSDIRKFYRVTRAEPLRKAKN